MQSTFVIKLIDVSATLDIQYLVMTCYESSCFLESYLLKNKCKTISLFFPYDKKQKFRTIWKRVNNRKTEAK